jgi:hypothetical protein
MSSALTEEEEEEEDGYPSYPHNIIIGLCSVIHISSTRNK